MKRPELRPDRRYLILTGVLVAVGVGVGLGVGLMIRSGGRAPGAEGGPCYGNGTCDSGLSCISQLCVASPGSPATTPPPPGTSPAGEAAAAAILAFGAGPGRSYQSLDFTLEVIENTLCDCTELHCLGEAIQRFRIWVSAADRPAMARMVRESARLASCTRRLYSPNRAIEAPLQLNKLGMNAKRAFAQMSQFPRGKVALTPATPCCQQPDHHCQWAPSTWQDPVWKSLDFEVHESFLFQYSYESAGKNENLFPSVKLRGPEPP